MIGKAGSEDLRLGFQPPEGARMDHAVAVALEGVAVGMRGFGIDPAPALRHREPQPRQHGAALLLRRELGVQLWATRRDRRICSSLMGARNLRASALFLPVECLASVRVAWSLETKTWGEPSDRAATFRPGALSPVSEIDLRQRQLGQRRVVLSPWFGHVLRRFFSASAILP